MLRLLATPSAKMSASARSERERRKSLRFMIKNPLQQVGGGKLLSFAKRILGAHKAHRQEEEIRCQRLEVRCPTKSRSQESESRIQNNKAATHFYRFNRFCAYVRRFFFSSDS